MKQTFKIGDKVICRFAGIFNGLDSAPPLKLEKEYTVLNIIQDSQGNDHIDVGLLSMVNYVRSLETKEFLPNGGNIHWCHPSRFILL